MSEHRVVVVSGIPASGKSTLAGPLATFRALAGMGPLDGGRTVVVDTEGDVDIRDLIARIDLVDR